jgi:electron transfer flavoprotein alpha/beta subunit
MRSKTLAPLALIPLLVCIASAQEVNAPRIPNLPRIAKAWNSIQPATEEWNAAMGKADHLLHDRFNLKVMLAEPDQSRRETVAAYKAAREALLKELDALNVLIEEEDY